MKKYIFLTLFCIVSINCKSQTTVNINTFNQGSNTNKHFKDIENYRQRFVGVWENTTGITTFRMIFHLTDQKPMGYPVKYYKDCIEGKFLIIENAGTPNEVIIHDSEKTYPNGITSIDVIYGVAGPTGVAGDFQDTCASGGDGVITGFFTFNVLNPNNNPLQAQWKIKKPGLLQGQYFSIPMEVIMTKVN